MGQDVATLAAQLVHLREQADWEASRRLLPSLASSLAYSNLSSWQQQHPGQQLPEVAPGVGIADLYKAAEREEARLHQWQQPGRQRSSLDSFADRSGYKHLAQQALARARARFAGLLIAGGGGVRRDLGALGMCVGAGGGAGCGAGGACGAGVKWVDDDGLTLHHS
eukprot:gene6995-7209_t